MRAGTPPSGRSRAAGATRRRGWAANGVLFAAYHVHVPWMIPATLLVDTFTLSYPTKRYRSAWIGIAVHSAQGVFLAAIVLTLVLRAAEGNSLFAGFL